MSQTQRARVPAGVPVGGQFATDARSRAQLALAPEDPIVLGDDLDIPLDIAVKRPRPGKSLADTRPLIAAQWHPTRNDGLSASDISATSRHRVWWQCANGHEWPATPKSRSGGAGACLTCVNSSFVQSLANAHPELAGEWHPERNDDLTPATVGAGSDRKVWWQCESGHEWEATVSGRANGNGCPSCATTPEPGQSLADLHPEVARQWDLAKNGEIGPFDVTHGSHRIVFWRCSRNHTWPASIVSRTRGAGCPRCAGRRTTTK